MSSPDLVFQPYSTLTKVQILKVRFSARPWRHLEYTSQEPPPIILKGTEWWRGLIELSSRCLDRTPVSEVIGSNICLWFSLLTTQPLTVLRDSPLSNSCLDAQLCVQTFRKYQLLIQCPTKPNYAADLQSFMT